MIYIPNNWIINKNNETEIRALILECVGCLRFEDSSVKAIKRLKELGEYIILEKLNDGIFAS